MGGVTYGPGPSGTYFPPGEVGPAILLPDGTVFATGSAASGRNEQAGATGVPPPVSPVPPASRSTKPEDEDSWRVRVFKH